MASADDSVFASSPFKFVVDGNLLYIHAGLIALHSEPLNRMISGPMSEAQQGYADLQDVDKGTFIRFMRWAYNGIYFPAEFSIDPAPNSATTEKPADEPPVDVLPAPYAEVAWAFGPKKKGKKQRHYGAEPPPEAEAPPPAEDPPPVEASPRPVWSTWPSAPHANPTESPYQRKLEMKESFINRKYDVPAINFSQPPPRSNQGPLEDYSEVFLSHARVYVFADKYDIEPLKNLALQNLHQTLAIYNLYPERCGDIIALIRYSYANTVGRVGAEDLQALLTDYMGLEMATLARDEDFKTLLLEDGGAVLGDFLNMVTKRVE